MTITPEQARKWRDDARPGPWYVHTAPDDPHWHTAIPYDRGFDEDQCTQLAETFRANNPHNKYRIVRRLVSKPEVID